MTSPVDIPHRIAIVHEWLTGMRGGEKCVEALCELFPQATLFCLIHVPGSVSPTIERMPIQTSFLQHFPSAQHHYRQFLPLFPTAVERFRLEEFDLVISSNHCVAKGARAPDHALHICYCYTPMRYIWNLYDEYFGKGRAGLVTRATMKLLLGYLRRWDVRTAANPHHFVAISENVRERIQSIYGRSADVIYPPVDTERFRVSRRDEGYYLIVSALVPYKRIDLAIEGFNRSGERLVIVGSGPDTPRLKKMAHPNIDFRGWQSDDAVQELYAGCRAVIFPGEEDFGIVPLEAMATGKPVIAFARGGALETVRATPQLQTGVLFEEQTVDALLDAVGRLRSTRFNADALRAFALQFGRVIYKRRMEEYIREKWGAFSGKSP
jgi:glycosyltransferase involved in cell wall biosynthesis